MLLNELLEVLKPNLKVRFETPKYILCEGWLYEYDVQEELSNYKQHKVINIEMRFNSYGVDPFLYIYIYIYISNWKNIAMKTEKQGLGGKYEEIY